ncbi:DNA mismatch repair protein MutS2 [Scopulibacillus darangshiensis]|uniref:Endonuclease MutS2 n=1 Tax=Scopulibacillus darangshiensis TaxID=442528 RepID=A0A4R2PAY3_9BACL|nr:endonuclease MutS2 [Scopulibacillus darangshiensis]TCP32127.1 DNA mismatch repair protein MutS2 [Scopulibacillus darangshiensis]
MLERVLNVLEFHKVKKQLEAHASSSLGLQVVEQLTPEHELSEVKRLQQETDEGANVLRLKGHAPFGGITDIRASLKRSEIGGMLNAKELIDIADTIRGTRLIKQFIEDIAQEEAIAIPALSDIVETIEPEGELERRIKSCIDDQGYVLDTASDKLRGVRTQIRTYDSRIKEKLEAIVRSSNYQKMLSESIVTIRNDRHVVPVKQEYRGVFGGIVHDQSASGATLFIEPQAIVDLNNKLSEARAKERHEVERILTDLSEGTAAAAFILYEHVERLAHLDFIFAKAKFGKSMKATRPVLNDNGNMNLKKARHPLIPSDDVMPIDIRLGDDYHAIIITGPNTGGKTVTLKTLGLLTLMAQSGLHIPVEEDSEINVFEAIFADIGDEQSIEQSLSTFSSHMTNIIGILSHVDHHSLVLFDELGAGTDPQEGAALSIAILDAVYNRGATVVATTHYSELKAYAYERAGVMNASVEFDVKTLRPTYRLLMGVPGRSNAFEISRKLGLNEEIIRQAKSHISSETNQVDKMIASLEKNRKEAEFMQQEAKRMKEDIEQKQKALAGELDQLERNKENVMNNAREKAQSAVDQAKEEAENIIRELRQFKSKSENVKEHQLIDAKSRLDHALDALTPNETKRESDPYKKKAETYKPGQEVKVISFGQKGHIVEKLSGNEYLVQVGIMKMNLPASDLKRVKAEKETKPVVNVRTANRTTKTELDLRGERYEDAMSKLEQYFDAALLAGYHQVSIIHGKGTGALRKGVQNFIKNHSRIKSSRLGGAGEGGSGVTVVELK